MKQHNTRNSVIREAAIKINIEGDKQYGDPVENAVREALVASATTGKQITPADVVKVLMSKKQVRAGKGFHHDSNVDLAGYAEIHDRVLVAMQDGTVQKMVENILNTWVAFPEPAESIKRR